MFFQKRQSLLDEFLFVGTNSISPQELQASLQKCFSRGKKRLFKEILENRDTLQSFDIHLVRIMKIPNCFRGYTIAFPKGKTAYAACTLWEFGTYHVLLSDPHLEEPPERDSYENLFSFHLT